MHKLTPSSYEELHRDFTVDVPENYNFAFDSLDAIAESHPDRLALIHIDPQERRQDVTFAQLKTMTCKLANALAGKGIGRGDRVMLILYRRLDFWVSMLALHRLGAVAIPSPSLLTEKDITYRANAAKMRAAIVEDSVSETFVQAHPQCPTLQLLIQAGETPAPEGWEDYDELLSSGSEDYPRPADSPGGDDPLMIFFTSGTTGQPKMVEHIHTYPLGHVVTGVYWHDLEEGDIHLTVSDSGWGKAVWGKMYGQWIAGATVFVYDFRGKFDPAALLRIMSENKVSTFCAPPTVYRFLIREDLSEYDLSAIRHCTTAGELLNDSVFHAWNEHVGVPIFEGYGQTETTLQVATFPFMAPKPGALGRPTPGWDIVLLDLDGNEVPAGDEGEICIKLDPRPVGLFTRYLDEPQKTEAAMAGGVYHTGDKAWMDEDGYVWFLGRIDDLIKSSGYRIGPFEVESALVAHDAVVEAAVTGVPDEHRGQLVKATVVLGPDYSPGDALTKELQDHVKKVTAPYKYPRVIEYVSELPKTISGKIKRAEIRAKDEN